ncbi:MAG: hypothetical protein ACKOAI_08400, partial [Acidimicrobiia bacterium]
LSPRKIVSACAGSSALLVRFGRVALRFAVGFFGRVALRFTTRFAPRFAGVFFLRGTRPTVMLVAHSSRTLTARFRRLRHR